MLQVRDKKVSLLLTSLSLIVVLMYDLWHWKTAKIMNANHYQKRVDGCVWAVFAAGESFFLNWREDDNLSVSLHLPN